MLGSTAGSRTATSLRIMDTAPGAQEGDPGHWQAARAPVPCPHTLPQPPTHPSLLENGLGLGFLRGHHRALVSTTAPKTELGKDRDITEIVALLEPRIGVLSWGHLAPSFLF